MNDTLTLSVALVGSLLGAMLAMILAWLRRLDRHVIELVRDHAGFRGEFGSSVLALKADSDRHREEFVELRDRLATLERAFNQG